MRRTRLTAVLAVAASIVLTACLPGSGAGSSPAAGPAHAPNPLAGAKLYVDPDTHAAVAVKDLHARGDHNHAQLLEKIARQPMAHWLTGAPDDAQVAGQLAAQSFAQGAIPTFVLYNLPQRDAGGGFSSGGAADPAAYQAWVQGIADAIGGHSAIIIMEPDAVTAVADHHLDGYASTARLASIKQGIVTLAALPQSFVYLDAGNAGWKSPADMVWPLREAGVDQAKGIAVNVSNFYSDDDSQKYGTELLRQLGDNGGMVIDSSRNGNGPSDIADNPWCNPPGRAIGNPPSTGFADSLVNAWLWIKIPGDSDGSCRDGAPPAGDFWLQYAIELVLN